MSKIIDIIQGDSAQYLVNLSSVEDIEIVESIVFCSCRLGIHKEIPYDSDLESYVLSFSAEETQNYPACRADYSITVRFADGIVRTPCLRGDMFIREKHCG